MASLISYSGFKVGIKCKNKIKDNNLVDVFSINRNKNNLKDFDSHSIWCTTSLMLETKYK